MTDWYAWHQPYGEEQSPLSQRLRLVQQHITAWLDQRPAQSLRILSVCAGQGRDLIPVLAARPDAARVTSYLLEYDARNISAARVAARAAGLRSVTFLRADAGALESYVGAVPADLVLLAGVLGNISEADVHRTVSSLPRLCADGATVIWTRTRRAPDLTPSIRAWLRETGFAEHAFHAPDGVLFAVGVHQFTGAPLPLRPLNRIFSFAD